MLLQDERTCAWKRAGDTDSTGLLLSLMSKSWLEVAPKDARRLGVTKGRKICSGGKS
jgi:hypothetical protein